jgi:hypothetical protein
MRGGSPGGMQPSDCQQQLVRTALCSPVKLEVAGFAVLRVIHCPEKS